LLPLHKRADGDITVGIKVTHQVPQQPSSAEVREINANYKQSAADVPLGVWNLCFGNDSAEQLRKRVVDYGKRWKQQFSETQRKPAEQNKQSGKQQEAGLSHVMR
jgi:hypothetical protein